MNETDGGYSEEDYNVTLECMTPRMQEACTREGIKQEELFPKC